MPASLAIEVVFPQPFTPATMITVGPLAAKRIGLGGLGQQRLELRLMLSSTSSILHHAAAELAPTSSTISWAACTPMSVLTSFSNSSSRKASSTSRPWLLNRSRTSVFRSWVVFSDPASVYRTGPWEGEGLRDLGSSGFQSRRTAGRGRMAHLQPTGDLLDFVDPLVLC